MVWYNMLTHGGLIQHSRVPDQAKNTIPILNLAELEISNDLGECEKMLEPTTDDQCFTEGEAKTLLAEMDGFDEAILEKWKHCANCGGCCVRFSMVQLTDMTRPTDMRVIVMEFIKAIGLTYQYGQVGEAFVKGGKKPSRESFMRTCFGILSHKMKHCKPGFAFTIDFRKVDERTREG